MKWAKQYRMGIYFLNQSKLYYLLLLSKDIRIAKIFEVIQSDCFSYREDRENNAFGVYQRQEIVLRYLK